MKKNLLKMGIIAIALSFLFLLSGCDELFLEPPNAPFITGSYTATTTTISWNSVSGAKEYLVYAAPGNTTNLNSFSLLGTTTATSYVDYTTAARSYAVKASNSAGTSGWSNVAIVD
jgi:hypothetical protein